MMADIPTGDDDLFDDFDAIVFLGRKCIEMAERVKTAEKFAEGAKATFKFEMDGQRYTLDLHVDRSAG